MKKDILRYVNVALLAILIVLYFALRQVDTVGLWLGIVSLGGCAVLTAGLWTLELIREREKYLANPRLFALDLVMGATAMFALTTMIAMAAANLGPVCSLPR